MMLEAFNAGTGKPGYSQLYEQLYTFIKKKGAAANTATAGIGQLRCEHGCVLGIPLEPGNAVYQVVNEDGKVTINCGALHGMKNDAQSIKSMAVSTTDKKRTLPPPLYWPK